MAEQQDPGVSSFILSQIQSTVLKGCDNFKVTLQKAVQEAGKGVTATTTLPGTRADVECGAKTMHGARTLYCHAHATARYMEVKKDKEGNVIKDDQGNVQFKIRTDIRYPQECLQHRG